MRKKLLGTMMCAALTASLLAGCSAKAAETTTAAETTAAPAAESTEAAAETKAEEASEAGSEAAASDYEFKDTITLICPVKAGGDTDRNTRLLAQYMQKYAGVNVVVKNVDGGATVMGMQECLDAKPDGNSLVVNGTDMFVPYMQGSSEINIDSFKTVAIPLIDNTTVLAVLLNPNAQSGGQS